MLRPPDEEILTPALRTIALVAAAAVLTAACANELTGSRPRSEVARSGAPPPPAPSRNTAAIDDPLERARFACAVEVQRAQRFDPDRSLFEGTLLGAVIGGAAGAGLGALFGLIGDVPGHGATIGAIAGGGTGMMIGGPLRLAADGAAYERGFTACVAARTISLPTATAGLVEYRLRTLSLWHDAFIAFLGPSELTDGVAGPGLMHLAGVADAGMLGRGIVLYDRHITAVPASLLATFGATPVEARVKLGGSARDFWDEARWYGRPGERSAWMITARNRRPQELRRIGLSDAAAIAQFRPTSQPLFSARLQGAVAIPLGVLRHAEGRGVWTDAVTGGLDPTRAIAAVVARNDDAGFPDRVYLVVTHAASAATYEAVLAWSERMVERGTSDPRGP